ncbi:Ly6/PLAUR domain-containing protein 2 [Sciurus carolinensis]|uniref:Ly6/PLAUR domain-containing protein 2 n=1 Tax=Sciurus carolinensis TaxID=30640 RepID=A0AA41N3F9_SCICA|nr:Ly6/PLAUR domain-containing protein 2 [Sciurus carolinensis]
MWETRLSLLASALAACREFAMALKCYACHVPTGVSSCITITSCNAKETMCKSTLYSGEIVNPSWEPSW